MAEVGRAAVRDPGTLLPGGFWAAVAVWLERPQVANKRLCGVRLEARRRAARPGTEPRGPRPSADPGREESAAAGCRSEEGPGPGQRSPEGGSSSRPGVGPGESRGWHQAAETEREAAAAAPLLAGAPGQPGEGDGPAPDLDALWDDFSRSLVGDHREMLAFLAGPGAGLRAEAPHELDVVLRTVIPKGSRHCPRAAPRREMVAQDVLGGAVTFLPLEEDEQGSWKVQMSNVYQIQLSRSADDWFISVLIFCPERWQSDGIVYPKPAWLGQELPVRLARWSVASGSSGFKSSLSLLPILKYSRTYQELKDKYQHMVQVWPEVTDPEKFVYEDVAIAAYLLVLWEEERAAQGVIAKQSFVDLGCGNGLLVHILSDAGHPGRGVDVRRRKIWDVYGPQTRLEEAAITPSDETLFPDADWLIGNHSDELTPWVPVIAARSSYRCRFFVLPCCFFDFAGRYRRRQSGKTQYREYLDFVREVGSACGFHVEEDCLRIPSTKRVCLLGRSRTYPPTAEALADQQRAQYISSSRAPGPAPAPLGAETGSVHCCHRGLPDGLPGDPPNGPGALEPGAEGCWLPGFRPRDRAERVRNCTALPREFVDQVVLQVASLLLGGAPLSPGSPPSGSPPSGSTRTWNPGASLSLAEVAGELDRETLRRLKRECGGLQTLLRNSHQVFAVLNGRVRFRDWREEKLQEEKQPEAKRRLLSTAFKTRLCWFFSHHPDGCALPADRCPFAHGPAELRPPPASKRRKRPL
ncbi:probable tRNA (uracil-O(2)-)-methyltransferase isoform X1 [Pipistrellus kuhlii]|uniref:tRNA (uracil-O(2)-)-methyltransferase n=2 Tax=Pipistrellus kuhlii TaxID=59472 RepID=A0A7J7RVM5_PIPKU|nr:probable tRNA (uracil-O(2)-)-methyltransferase isoform X1 [Pipistrellus kuhlii]KAF6280222.1 tRNA methyltransferase 44-like protein [Pipistrellus kuhlii]